MPKTVSIAPSWYWPANTPRFCGIPPFGIEKLILGRLARERADEVVVASPEGVLSGSELYRRVVLTARALQARGTSEGMVSLSGEPSLDHLIMALATIVSPFWVAISKEGGRARLALPTGDAIEALPADEAGSSAPDDSGSLSSNPERPALGWVDDTPIHSESSLVSAAISLSLFFSPLEEFPRIICLAPTDWGWPAAILSALYRSAPVWLGARGEWPRIPDGPPTVIVGDLASLGQAARESKKEVRSARGRVAAVIATIGGAFDVGDRKRLEKLLDCPVLTLFGSREAGPVIASHPSWYVSESAGIPVTNADVMPVDPRTKEPIQTLWELVEYAQVTVRSPMVAPFRRVDSRVVRSVGGLADLQVLGSSDPNGMIYLLPD